MNSTESGESVYQIMTAVDWFGLSLSVTLFLLVIGSYAYVIAPWWGGKLENQKYMIFNDDDQEERGE